MGMTPQHFHTIPTSCAILPYYVNPLVCILGCNLFAKWSS